MGIDRADDEQRQLGEEGLMLLGQMIADHTAALLFDPVAYSEPLLDRPFAAMERRARFCHFPLSRSIARPSSDEGADDNLVQPSFAGEGSSAEARLTVNPAAAVQAEHYSAMTAKYSRRRDISKSIRRESICERHWKDYGVANFRFGSPLDQRHRHPESLHLEMKRKERVKNGRCRSMVGSRE